MRRKIFEKKNQSLYLVLLLFAIIYSSISFVNHYNFRTYGHDLGINNNAIYDYAHFRWNDCMIMFRPFENVLSDHFTIYPILVSPFYWIFGTYTMLIFQILATLFGGLGIYRLIHYLYKDHSIALIASIHFFTFWGIFSALSFDYHDNVVSTMFVPWLFLFFFQKKFKLVLLFSILILIGKENMALWLSFIGLGLLMENYRDKELRYTSVFIFFFSILYFVIVVKFIIPNIGSGRGEYLHFKFTAFGDSFGDVAKTLINSPIESFSKLIENHTHNPNGDGIKGEFLFFLIISGGYALFRYPQYLIMLLPILGQKLMHDEIGKWGINNHYSIEFAPIITIVLFKFVNDYKKHKKAIAIALTTLAIVFTVSSMDHRISKWYNPARLRLYTKGHWAREFDVSEVRKEINKIPKEAKVCASGCLASHLAMRDYIYHFPRIEDSDFIAVILDDYYPLNKDLFHKKIKSLLDANAWGEFYRSDHLLILKRK